MLNHIVLMGRLTRDPELRRTGSGVAVASFTLAVDRDYAAQGAEKETDFVDIVAWRNTAEFVSKYFTKGRMAVVTGRLQIRNWQDKEGNKRRSAEVVADNVYFASATVLTAVRSTSLRATRKASIRFRRSSRHIRPRRMSLLLRLISPCSPTTIPISRSNIFPQDQR